MLKNRYVNAVLQELNTRKGLQWCYIRKCPYICGRKYSKINHPADHVDYFIKVNLWLVRVKFNFSRNIWLSRNTALPLRRNNFFFFFCLSQLPFWRNIIFRRFICDIPKILKILFEVYILLKQTIKKKKTTDEHTILVRCPISVFNSNIVALRSYVSR